MEKRLSSLRQLELARTNIERQKKWSNMADATNTKIVDKPVSLVADALPREPLTTPTNIAAPLEDLANPTPVVSERPNIVTNVTLETPLVYTRPTVAPMDTVPTADGGSSLGGGGFGGGFGGSGAGDSKSVTPKKKSTKFIWIGLALVGGYIYFKSKK